MRKNKFFLLLLSAFMFAGTGVQAKQRTLSEARAIAEKEAVSLGVRFEAGNGADARALKRAVVNGAAPSYFVFPGEGDKGFIIVSGDDRLPAIVGYSDNGTYSEENMPDAMAAFLAMYSEMTKQLLAGDKDVTAAASEAAALRKAKSSKAVAPLLGNIKWTQNAPFNNLCPKYNGKDRSAVGCVATAMAQVMAYWKYPAALCADIPAYQTSSYSLSVSKIKKGETYDWDNMLDDYTGDYTTTQAEAVAKLSYHCGAAVKMDYGYSSGANVHPSDFVTYFGYDADLATEIDRNMFTLDEWTALIDRELQAGRPVLYGGSSSNGGHQFVCDGSDGKGLYHINWGWGGYQNGYFDITILNPKKGGTGSGTASDGYNRGCDMIIGLCPDNGKKDEPLVSTPEIIARSWKDSDHSVVVTKGTRTNVSGSFSVSMAERLNNYSSSDFTGYFTFGVKNADGSFSPIASGLKGTLQGREESGATYGFLLSSTFDYPFPVGTTTVYCIYSADGKIWKQCGYKSSLRPVIFTATATKLQELGSPLSAKVEAEDDLVVGIENNFGVTLTNNTDNEFIGPVNIDVTSSSYVRPSEPTTSIYVVVPAHSTVKRTVALTPDNSNLYVFLTDGISGTDILSGVHFTAKVEAAPSLSLVSAETNAAKDVYERNEAYYLENRVAAPRTEDGDAVFTYGIKNTGGTATLNYVMRIMSGESSSYNDYADNIRVPGGGKITYIKQNVEPSEVGSRSISCGFYIQNSDGTTYSAPTTTLPQWRLNLVDKTGYAYNMDPNELMVYVAGDVPTGLTAADANGELQVSGGKGELIVRLGSSEPVAVYAIDGSKVAVVEPVSGSVQHIALRPGVYVVKGRKVVVR